MSRLSGYAVFYAFIAAVVLGCSTVPARLSEEPAHEEAIGWEVSPAGGYSDEFGYVTLDFTPSEMSRDGGRLTVHLGRQSLEQANTVWYTFTVIEGSATLLSVSGVEGIPNIKGPDGNWWNDIELDLIKPFARDIRVEVQDMRIGATYSFAVRRVLTSGEARP